MRKIIYAASVFIILSGFNAFALDGFLETRSMISQESIEIKMSLPNSKDAVLLIGMWDSCMVTLTQLDAYFSMLGIFNEIKKEDLTGASVGYLINWLNLIKNTNDLNIKSLIATTKTTEPHTKVHRDKLMGYFGKLNIQITNELNRLSLLKKS